MMRTRRDPHAQYRAQEKAYVQRLRQDQTADWINESPQTPSVGFNTDSDADESPTEVPLDNDAFDQETTLFLGVDDMLPSTEQLEVPENRERLEWHSMLASVLKGDVVKQEKQRISGTTDQNWDGQRNNEIWLGVRARVCGRSVALQKKLIEDARANIGSMIEEIITFEIKGEAEVGKAANEQVRDIVERIEKCENMYSTQRELRTANARASSPLFSTACDAIVAWHNTTELINSELGTLRRWVGNEELDFSKTTVRTLETGRGLADEASFLDRLLREEGLQSLQGERSIFYGIAEVIQKAKSTLIENAQAFADRHLPPYIEELLTLINFPSRLVQEIIRVRLTYARKIKETAQQSTMLIDQMISQFQILLRLAVRIKQQYVLLSQPEPGWDLPPCVDENFDSTVVDALKYYFKMLNWKLGANKNTFREAEILEQEWDFSNEIGRQLEGGDIEVAEQFSSLTAKALLRLTAHFERELQSRPTESRLETEKRYKAILDSVRVRQRKLFRFSKILGQRFENATEYSLMISREQLQDFYDALVLSGHALVETESNDRPGLSLVASPTLYDSPKEIQSILGTSFHAEDLPSDPANPYVLIISREEELFWEGKKVYIDQITIPSDVKMGRLRLVADGSLQRLQNARVSLHEATGIALDIITEKRANLARVNVELNRIAKTAFKLSDTIMDSVEIIRRQNKGMNSQDLIQSCFAFAIEFGNRSLQYVNASQRKINNIKLARLSLDWVSFICDDCIASDRKTFKWAVSALEFAALMTQGQNLLDFSDEEYARLKVKVAGCMSLLISHFDIMGARSTLAAQAEKQRVDAIAGQFRKLDLARMRDDAAASALVSKERMAQLAELDELRKQEQAKRQVLGRVLEGSNAADRSLTQLSSSPTNVNVRWQQGHFVGGGTFGSVWAGLNLDTGYLMAVKEIRLQDPQMVPTIVTQIRDEMGILEVLDHPNIVQYYGVEVHRDKVYIFMEYCSGGSLANLLEHGRIEDETVVMVYALQMLEGLGYLHESGIVHRDIKPENILLDHNGIIKYVDFGAAKIIARQGKTLAMNHSVAAPPRKGAGGAANAVPGDGAGRKNQKTMTGTPMYMSPEVIRGDSATNSRHGSVDVWSLGCVILEMVTGRRPWDSLDNEWAIMYNIAQGNPPQLPAKDQLSELGIDFLKKCFERDPSKRASAAELLQHEWIVRIRQQVVIEPQTPGSENGSSSGNVSAGSSRQGSTSFA